MKKVFLDTETSGLAPGQIGQLAYIEETDDGIITGKNYFFDIDYVTRGAEEVTGRNVDFYKQSSNGKKFGDFSEELLSVFNGATLIAHNLKFDENFISAEFWRLGIVFKPTDRFDTMTYFSNVCKLPGRVSGQYKDPKLVELVDYFNINTKMIEKYATQLFGIDTSNFHDAMYDTTAMFVAFQLYREKLHGTSEWANIFCNSMSGGIS